MAKSQRQAANDDNLITEHEVLAAMLGCDLFAAPTAVRGLSARDRAIAEGEIDALMAKAGEDIDALIAVAKTDAERALAILLIEADARATAMEGA